MVYAVMKSKQAETNQSQFLTINEITWINQYVDTTRITWKTHLRKTLKTISKTNHLPTKLVKGHSSRVVVAYSIEAINLLKEKMEQHPEHFDNGRMLQQ